MEHLLNNYLKLEAKVKMELMLKEQVYITYYEKLSDFKTEMFFLDDQELTHFLDDYQLSSAKLTRDFIMLYDQNLDSYVVWTRADSLNIILNYFSDQPIYKHFII